MSKTQTPTQWTQLKVNGKPVWRENFSPGGRAEYYPKKDGRFGDQLGWLERNHGSSGGWEATVVIGESVFIMLFAEREEAEQAILGTLAFSEVLVQAMVATK